MTIIAERLTKLRKKYNLSQQEVAQKLNVTSSLVSAYEHGERNPAIDKLILLADIYHTSTDYILGRTNPINQTNVISVDGLNQEQINSLRKFLETIIN